MGKFCGNCGNQIEPGAKFCDNCGARLGGIPNESTTQYNIPAQPFVQQVQYTQPYNQQEQYNSNYVDEPPKKKHGCLIAFIVVIVIALITSAVTFALFKFKAEPSDNVTIPTENVEIYTKPASNKSATDKTNKKTVKKKSKKTKKTKKKKTKKSNKKSNKKSSKKSAKKSKNKKSKKTKLPYSNLGKPKDTDFAWIADAQSGNLTGAILGKKDFIGKWKAEIILDGIYELATITINKNGKVTISHYKINTGSGWKNTTGKGKHTLKGKFNVGGAGNIVATGSYGKLNLYQFVKSNGTQYGMGKLTLPTGDVGNVYLVRG